MAAAQKRPRGAGVEEETVIIPLIESEPSWGHHSTLWRSYDTVGPDRDFTYHIVCARAD